MSGGTYVYVVSAADPGPVKVGFARDPWNRLRSLQGGNHQRLHLRALLWCEDYSAALVESGVHARLDRFRIRSEWFGVSVAEARDALRKEQKRCNIPRCRDFMPNQPTLMLLDPGASEADHG